MCAPLRGAPPGLGVCHFVNIPVPLEMLSLTMIEQVGNLHEADACSSACIVLFFKMHRWRKHDATKKSIFFFCPSFLFILRHVCVFIFFFQLGTLKILFLKKNKKIKK